MDNANISLYEMNRILYTNVDKITLKDKKKAIKEINKYYAENKANYYLLLNHELRYVSILKIVDITKETLGEAVFECLENVGEVIELNYNEETMVYECWIKIEGKAHCIFLFAYDIGVVEVGGTR